MPRANAAQADAILISNAWIFDGSERAPFAGSILIENGHIAAVGGNIKVPRDAQRIDAHGAALLPGFIDVHTHWSPNGSPHTLPQIANAYIAAGVTTVNDFHEAPEAYAPRRAWLATIATPDVRFAARISTPLGHGADWADEATTQWVNTPAAARAAVDEVATYHPDLIKAFTDGWRYNNDPDNVSMGEDTLTALVEEAHSKGLKVFTHTVTLDRGKQAARAARSGRVEMPGIALAHRQGDMACIETIQGRIVAVPAAIDVCLRPGVRHEYVGFAGIAVNVNQPIDDPCGNAQRTSECG